MEDYEINLFYKPCEIDTHYIKFNLTNGYIMLLSCFRMFKLYEFHFHGRANYYCRNPPCYFETYLTKSTPADIAIYELSFYYIFADEQLYPQSQRKDVSTTVSSIDCICRVVVQMAHLYSLHTKNYNASRQ